jgi:excinuclease UvrABC ATPase subunit
MIESPLKLTYPISEKNNKEIFDKIKKEVLDAGFIRFSVGEKIFTINDEISKEELEKLDFEKINIVVDRLAKKDYSVSDSADTKRLKDSLSLAFKI